jgi:hypothetical protein
MFLQEKNTKLKLFCLENPNLTTVVEEQLLYFGLVNQKIINNNNTFKNLDNNDIINIVEYTDVKNCDFIYYPHKIHKNTNIDNLIELSETYNKKILLFYNDDDETVFNFKNSILFRTSMFKNNKPENYFSVPAFCNDLKKEEDFFLRKKETSPTIGFCGAITHPIRQTIIDEINKTELNKNFIIRDSFWGGNVWGHQVRSEYIQNTLNSDIVICLRGSGNFSYRFYETMCLGRIPLIVDTDLVLPFEEFISCENLILKIKKEDIKNLYQIINDFWEKIEDYENYQKDIISFWENNYSPLGFIKNINIYKNEINNLLHTKS